MRFTSWRMSGHARTWCTCTKDRVSHRGTQSGIPPCILSDVESIHICVKSHTFVWCPRFCVNLALLIWLLKWTLQYLQLSVWIPRAPVTFLLVQLQLSQIYGGGEDEAVQIQPSSPSSVFAHLVGQNLNPILLGIQVQTSTKAFPQQNSASPFKD